MASEEAAEETPPKPKKPAWMNIYNKSRIGQKITLKDGGKILPGTSGKVPYALGKKLIELPWVQRAERGDVLE